jgi:integrase
MAKFNSTAPSRPRKAAKPKKPHADFPLFPHANGQWAKKVRQKMHFFGVWADSQAALQRWVEEKDDLLAGRVPRCRAGVVTGPVLRDLVNRFLTTKAMLRDNGELSAYTWQAYHEISEELVAMFGKDRLLADILPEDFEKLRQQWAAKWGVVRLATEINRARIVFNFAYKNGLIDRPMRYGEGFRRPSKKVMRLNKAAKGPKMFEAAELREMVHEATQPMKAMLLFAINGGLGNNDIALLPLTALDLKTGWMVYSRPKTGIMRRVPLWRETIKAVKEWLAKRPTPKNEADAALVFLTARGTAWGGSIHDRPITHECRKLLDRLNINGNRNFYGCRHTFETIAGESRDQIAVNAIMGHDDGSMASVYRERISDERLQAVAEHVRQWLFGVDGEPVG